MKCHCFQPSELFFKGQKERFNSIAKILLTLTLLIFYYSLIEQNMKTYYCNFVLLLMNDFLLLVIENVLYSNTFVECILSIYVCKKKKKNNTELLYFNKSNNFSLYIYKINTISNFYHAGNHPRYI